VKRGKGGCREGRKEEVEKGRKEMKEGVGSVGRQRGREGGFVLCQGVTLSLHSMRPGYLNKFSFFL
jgi:hypothetical protein